MSNWINRIGDTATNLAKNAGKFSLETLNAVATPWKAAWDIGTAPWNSAEEYSGFSNTLKAAYSENVPNLVKPLASAGGAIMKVPGVQPTVEFIDKVNRDYIREPLTAAGLMATEVLAQKVGNKSIVNPKELVSSVTTFFDPNQWKEAYTGAQDISYGQALVGYGRSFYDPKFNIYDPSDREAAFEKSLWGKLPSGFYDLGAQFFGDVTLVGGKVSKVIKASELAQGVLKNADVIAKAAEDITKAQYGVNNRFKPLLEDFTKNDSAYALNHPIVKSSAEPGLLAHLLGESKDIDNTALILRSSMGDPAALDELRVLRADMSDALEAARGDLSAVDEFKLFAAPDDSGMLPFLNDNEIVIKAAEENYAALAKNDEYFSKLMGLGEGGGVLTRTSGPLVRGFENFIAEARATKFYDRTVGKVNVEVFQPTPFHRLYQKLSWAAGERPAGIVNFNDPDSYKEILATINAIDGTSSLRGKAIIPLAPEQSKAMLDSYIGAATPEARALAVRNLEGSMVRAIAKKHGVDETIADQLYNNYHGARTSAMRSINDKGFMVDTDGSIVTVPELESQSADYLPIMDFQLLDRVLKQNKNALNAVVGAGRHAVLTLADFTQDMFKAGALLRLGYTQRNAIDSQLRIAASVGAMATIQHLGPGIKHIINNSLAVPARLIDRYLPVDSGMRLAKVQQGHLAITRELTALKKEIAEVEAKNLLKKIDNVLFHGTSSKLELDAGELKWIHNNADTNLFGSGFYTTDDVNTAIGYTKKGVGSEPTIYKVNWKKSSEPKFLNLDDKMTPELKDVFVKTAKQFDKDYDLPYGLDDFVNKINNSDMSGSDAWQFLKEELQANAEEAYGGTEEIVFEGIQRLSNAIEKNGYDGLSHTGGSFRGKRDHNVKIFFNPSNLSLKEIDDLNPDLDLAGKLNTLKLLQEEKQAVYTHYSEVLNRYGDKAPKERIGTGSFSVTTTDGRTFELPDAFGGPLGDMFRQLASSQSSFERLVIANSAMYSKKLATKGIQAIRPTDPAYFDQWAQTLRQQFGNSAVIKKIAAGESLDDVARWLRNSPEGRDLRKRLNVGSRGADEYVTRVNEYFDRYLPKESGLRNKLSEITASDLRATFNDPTVLPIIHGHLLEETMFNLAAKRGKDLINSLFKLLGTLPEDTWARNPLYVHLYRKEAERRVQIMAQQLGDRFSVADQEKLMGLAHKTAQRQMKEILFNIERRSNLSAALKFISPFFSAQENAYKTWFKLAVANPQLANRGYQVWNAPNRAGLVTDQEGNPVAPGETSGNDIIWIGLPKGVTKIPFIGKGLEAFVKPDAKDGDKTIYGGGMGIPKASLDIMFQGGMDVLYSKGNPNVFSDIFPVGPYVAIPASEILKRKPNLEDSLKWALPYGGYKDAVSGLTPAWFQKLQTRQAGQDDPQFAKSYQLIWNTEQQKAKRNGRPPVSDSRILQMTKDYWNMRMAANFIMPFAPRFDSPYKFYLDKSREYKRKFGYEADTKFLEDYPDFFEFTTSLSSNPTGIQYSLGAVEAVKKHGDLVGQLKGIDPKLIGLVTNDPSGYTFSNAAYDYLYNKRISPNSPDKFLESQDPGEAQKRNEANKGWIQFNKISSYIDNEIAARLKDGRMQSASITSKGAEDLAFFKSLVIQKLSVKTDAQGKPMFDKKTGEFVPTEWYIDYKDSDGAKTNKVIKGLGAIIDNKKFWDENKDKPMWKSTDIYLQLRQAIASDLAKRPAKSIDAKGNKDIRIFYDAMVKKLKSDDPTGFAYLYDRFLSQDLIYDKYLTPKGSK